MDAIANIGRRELWEQLRPRDVCQSSLDLSKLAEVNLDCLMAAGGAADNAYLSRPQPKRVRKSLHYRRVGLPLDGSCAHPHSQRAIHEFDALDLGIWVSFDA